MNDNVAKVLNGIVNLTDSELAELMNEMEEYKKYPNLTKTNIKKALTNNKSINESYSVSLGPTPSGCPCCGR